MNKVISNFTINLPRTSYNASRKIHRWQYNYNIYLQTCLLKSSSSIILFSCFYFIVNRKDVSISSRFQTQGTANTMYDSSDTIFHRQFTFPLAPSLANAVNVYLNRTPTDALATLNGKGTLSSLQSYSENKVNCFQFKFYYLYTCLLIQYYFRTSLLVY